MKTLYPKGSMLISITLICGLLVSCATNESTINFNSSPSIENGRINYGELTLHDVPSGDENCKRLLDVKFHIVNGSGSGVLPKKAEIAGDQIFTTQQYWNFHSKRLNELIKEKVYSTEELTAFFFNTDENEGASDDFSERIEAEYLAEYYSAKISANSPFENMDGTTRVETEERFVTERDGFRKLYVRQKSPNTCYAATLQTALAYMGWTHSHDDIIRKRVPACGKEIEKLGAASFNEIISTANYLITNTKIPYLNFVEDAQDYAFYEKLKYRQGSYYGVKVTSNSGFHIKNKSLGEAANDISVPLIGLANPMALHNWHAKQMNELNQMSSRKLMLGGQELDLYRSLSWTANNNKNLEGYIGPIVNTGDMVSALLRKNAIVLGLKEKKGSHTYLITGIDYSPVYSREENGSISINEDTRIYRVRVLDPSPTPKPEYWIEDMDDFFSRFQFALKIHDDRVMNKKQITP